jgi:acyl-CoA thioester hydrolase
MSDMAARAVDRRRPPPVRADFIEFGMAQTRWSDNDRYGHINNAVYTFYFDSAINRYLISYGGLDIHSGPVIAVAAETWARYVASFAYPDEIEVGLAVVDLSARSVRYAIGLFLAGEDYARVFGEFVHVFCERETMRPTPMPERMRIVLQRLQRTAGAP